jgi:hypothetical protein
MQESVPLVGRDETSLLISALMERPLAGGHRVSAFRPVLVLSDPRGGGKTVLIESLRQTFSDLGIPFAILDVEKQKPEALRDVIFAVAYQLSRDWGDPYQEIVFHRLAVARLVTQMSLSADPAQRAQARTEIEQTVQTARRSVEAVRESLSAGAGDLAQTALAQFGIPGVLAGQLVTAARRAPGWGLGLLRRSRAGRRAVLGEYYTWFGDRGVGRPQNPADELLDLHLYSRPGEYEQNRQWVDELLLSALLADLSDHFAGHPAEKDLDYGCALLMDNADHPIGRAFVAALVEARAQRGARPDPLTAVVTSRGGVLSGLAEDEFIDFSTDSDPSASASEEWSTRVTNLTPPWIARRRLSDLDPADTAGMVDWVEISGGEPRVTKRLIHEVTDGQPACTRNLVTVLGAHPDDRDFPRRLLARPRPARGPEPLADWMLKYLTDGQPAEHLDDLATCAAAVDLGDARALGGLRGVSRRTFAIAESVLWPPLATASTAVVRRLLRERLAARDQHENNSWEKVFEILRKSAQAAPARLAEDFAAEGEPSAEQVAELRGLRLRALAYGLANGEADPAVEYLTELLPLVSPAEWLRCLQIISNAPHRPSGQDASPYAEFYRRVEGLSVSGPPPLREIGDLVIGGWIIGDRLTDSRRGHIFAAMAHSVETIRVHSPHNDYRPFRFASERYSREKDFWP